jgi:predicted RND superfamily exporter protein
LGQLGTLVAVGVGLAAVVMLYVYLPPLVRSERQTPIRRVPTSILRAKSEFGTPGTKARIAWAVTAVLVVAGVCLLRLKPPQFNSSAETLKPTHSEANAALEELKLGLNRQQEPLWVVVQGRDESEVAQKIAVTEGLLQRAVSNQLIAGFTLPTELWPQVENQRSNCAAALALTARRDELRQATLAAGFAGNAFAVADNVLRAWQSAALPTNVFWPTNSNSRWILEKLTARTTHSRIGIGLVHPNRRPSQSLPEFSRLSDDLQTEGVWLSGWELLGPSVSVVVTRDLLRVLLPITVLVLVTLWLAFRSWRDVFWSMATLLFSALMLHLVMAATGWSWNMMNLMALPLLLGMGVDFNIHIQLALRRHCGDAGQVRGSVGRALLLAGSTTVAGFASLAFASNAGIAGLGKICAVGIICAMLTAVYLLPTWWRMTAVKKTAVEA